MARDDVDVVWSAGVVAFDGSYARPAGVYDHKGEVVPWVETAGGELREVGINHASEQAVFVFESDFRGGTVSEEEVGVSVPGQDGDANGVGEFVK